MRMSSFLLALCSAASLYAADIAEGDQFWKKGDFKSAARCYNEAYYSAATPRERIAGGLKWVRALRKLGNYEMAHNVSRDIGKNPDALPKEKIDAWLLNIDINRNYLNNIYDFNRAAQSLRAIKEATPEQKKFAIEIQKEYARRKKTQEMTPAEQKYIAPIKAQIRKDHPRMFFTKETFPLVVKHNQRPDIRKYFDKNVRTLAKNAPDEPKLWTGEQGKARKKDANGYHMVERPNFYGTEAAACALIYLLEGDKAYFDKAIRLLDISAQAVDECYNVGVLAGGEYYCRPYLYALCAWDWLYNDMTPEQRERIGKELLKYAARIEPDGQVFQGYWSNPETGGFYNIHMVKWYAALTFYNSDIDEAVVEKLLYEGYRDHEILLTARDITTGDDGGIVSTANNYLMATYLWTTYNYLASWESALNKNRANEVKHLRYFPQWCVWSLINGTERQFPRGEGKFETSYLYDFGNGDTENTTKEAVKANLYLYEILHFFPNDPEVHKMVMGCITEDPMNPPVWPNLKYRPITPVIRYNLPPLPEKFGRPEYSLKDHARYFENLGIVFMRSGSTPTDTYASFVSGKINANHRHFDANSFSIYKYDFLALDTGTRFGVQNKDYEQLNAYYAQTVAHNAMLIHMPGENMPDYWWKPRKPNQYVSHGGQDRTFGDRTLAYETNDHFTYIAGDATAVYSKEKCKMAIRQFFFVYPDIFVVADRVTTVKPEYRKEWIIHSQNEPVMVDDATFHFDDGGGRLFCKTLLPAAFQRTVVGGEGKEFFASGKNWELPDSVKHLMNTKNHLGRYRVEVAPAKENNADYFLHVIQVGADSMPKMVDAALVETKDSFGTEFVTDQGKWQITFAKSGNAAGHVKLVQDGKVKIDRPMRKDIQPQAGLE